MHAAAGFAASIASGRISFALGLTGPATSVDTACSSSLVAVHMGACAMRLAEARDALCGGVNLTLSPEVTKTLQSSGVLASDGRCKALDAAADGYLRSEGVGMLVLGRVSMSNARLERQPLALLNASIVNQDGSSSALTAPNGRAQIALLNTGEQDHVSCRRVLG